MGVKEKLLFIVYILITTLTIQLFTGRLGPNKSPLNDPLSPPPK